MKWYASFLLLIFCFFMSGAVTAADDETITKMLSAIVQSCFPDCQIFDYVPVGQEQKEYLILAADPLWSHAAAV